MPISYRGAAVEILPYAWSQPNSAILTNGHERRLFYPQL